MITELCKYVLVIILYAFSVLFSAFCLYEQIQSLCKDIKFWLNCKENAKIYHKIAQVGDFVINKSN